MTARFHHAGLVVPDLEKASAFYMEFLGAEEAMRFDWDRSNSDAVEKVINLADSAAKVVMLKVGDFNVELFEYSAPEQFGNPAAKRPCDPGIAHIAFEFDDIAKASETFVSAGGSLHGDAVDLGNTYAIYGRDPFGNIVELMQPKGAN